MLVVLRLSVFSHVYSSQYTPLACDALVEGQSLLIIMFSDLLTMMPKSSATPTKSGGRSVLAINHTVVPKKRTISELVGSSHLDVQDFQH